MTIAHRVPTILFLIADTGGGHRSAANAIRAAMDLIAPESFPPERSRPLNIDPVLLPFDAHRLVPAQWGGAVRPWHAEIRDIFQECGRYPLGEIANNYGPTVEFRPRMYAGIWHATNTRPTYGIMSIFTKARLRRGLIDLFSRIHPDVIVSVHSLLTRPSLRIMQEMGVRVPFLTVVTDLVRFHRSWSEPEVDEVAVPTDAARDLIIAQGMPPEKVRLLGMPIHPKFCLPPPDRAAVRRSLGLDPARLTVLLVGGGEGVGGIAEAARAIGAAHLPIQQIVITGRNRALQERMSAERGTIGVPTAILGFVQNMPDLMHAADLIVTKAGPGTIAEALACELPIILSGAIPGQEYGNIGYVVHHQVGEYATTPDDIVAAISRFAQLDPQELAAMRARAHALSNPRASFDIAQMILRYLPSIRAISLWNQPPVRVVRRVMFRRERRKGTGRFLRPVRRLLRLGENQRTPLFIRRRRNMRPRQ